MTKLHKAFLIVLIYCFLMSFQKNLDISQNDKKQIKDKNLKQQFVCKWNQMLKQNQKLQEMSLYSITYPLINLQYRWVSKTTFYNIFIRYKQRNLSKYTTSKTNVNACISFQVKDGGQIRFEEFQKLVKQVIIVCSAFDMGLRAYFKQHKVECEIKNDYFIVNLILLESEQLFCNEFQEMLLDYFAETTTNELLLFQFSSMFSFQKISDISPNERTIPIIMEHITKECEISINSLIWKFKPTLQVALECLEQKDNKLPVEIQMKALLLSAVEEQSSSLGQIMIIVEDMMFLFSLLQDSDIKANMDPYSSKEFEDLGILANPLLPINLPFQPVILIRLKQFITEVLNGNIKVKLQLSALRFTLKMFLKPTDLIHVFELFFSQRESNE